MLKQKKIQHDKFNPFHRISNCAMKVQKYIYLCIFVYLLESADKGASTPLSLLKLLQPYYDLWAFAGRAFPHTVAVCRHFLKSPTTYSQKNIIHYCHSECRWLCFVYEQLGWQGGRRYCTRLYRVARRLRPPRNSYHCTRPGCRRAPCPACPRTALRSPLAPSDVTNLPKFTRPFYCNGQIFSPRSRNFSPKRLH